MRLMYNTGYINNVIFQIIEEYLKKDKYKLVKEPVIKKNALGRALAKEIKDLGVSCLSQAYYLRFDFLNISKNQIEIKEFIAI
jgi:hypothetical protein